MIDYSPENIFLLNSVSGKKLLLRYQYLPSEIDRLKNYHNPITDVVFVGTSSPKRAKVIDALKNAGVKVNWVQGFGDDRDQQLMQGKILLNIHFSDEYSVYESIRCDRHVFAGMIVVSEKSQNQEQNDINPLLFIEEYNNLVSKILDILKDYDTIHQEYLERSAITLPEIIQQREKDIEVLERFLAEDLSIHDSISGNC